MLVGTKLEAFAPFVLPPPVAVDTRDIAETQARLCMIAGKLRLLPVVRIVQRKMV